MTISEYFDSKKTLNLVGHKKNFNFFKDLILKDMLPKVIMLSGEKGIGKATLINHIMHFYFEKKNYDENNNKILKRTHFTELYENDLFSNIIYLKGSEFKNIKIEDIRILKSNLLKTTLNNDKRFIIFDDVENFNTNSLNALLKLIEEPGVNNYFILINNKTKPLLETIKSRSLEIKIILDEESRKKIISFLLKNFEQKISLNEDLVATTPGNFVKFNYVIQTNKIKIEDNFLDNLEKLLKLYKKEKNLFFKDLILFLFDYYFQIDRSKKIFSNDKLIEKRTLIVKNINNFFLYNLSQSALLSSIKNNI
tara:strand:- start:14 stop:940 length:927 start_codon:yes stop_codon:yes gene_type:complete